MTKWRIGRKVPINVYEGDRPVCQCHTVGDAALIVNAVNEQLERAARLDAAHFLEDAPADAGKKRRGTKSGSVMQSDEGTGPHRGSQKAGDS